MDCRQGNGVTGGNVMKILFKNSGDGNQNLVLRSSDQAEIEDAHKVKQVALIEPQEEFQIPVLQTSDESRELHKVKVCKMYYSEEGCSFGTSCDFLHDAEIRETDAICLVPGTSGERGSGSIKPALNPSNWKTRMCYKWELNGSCPHGNNCRFAHGATELRPYGGRYGGRHTGLEVKDSSTRDTVQGAVPANTSAHAISAPCTVRVPSQRLLQVNNQNSGTRPRKWKGPDKISKIYGDWIDDL